MLAWSLLLSWGDMTHIEFMKHVRSEVHASLRDLETGGGGEVGGHTELQETKKLLNGVDGGEGGGGRGLGRGTWWAWARDFRGCDIILYERWQQRQSVR